MKVTLRSYWLIAVIALALPLSVFAQAGETKNNVSGWTVDTLKAHFDELRVGDRTILGLHKELSELRDKHAKELREAADKRYGQRFEAQESAQLSYKTSSNEFRGTLSDQAGRFVSRSELGGYVLGLVGVMGVLVAWLTWGQSRNARQKPPWLDEVLRAMKSEKSS